MDPASLAVGAIGLTALFSTCIDTFNIAITARDFGRDYEVICADLALQRLRFCLWGETLGLVSRDASGPLVEHAGLGDKEARATLERALRAILLLLQDTERLRDDFNPTQRSSLGLKIFSQTYEKFRSGAATRRQQAPARSAFKWAIYGADKFKGRVESLKGLIDGLEQVSEKLGVIELQRARLRTEVDSLEDVESLRLLRDASSNENDNAFEVVSSRLSMIEAASSFERSTGSDNATYFTAPDFGVIDEAVVVDDSDIRMKQQISSDLSVGLAQNCRVIANLGLRPEKVCMPMDYTKIAAHGSRLGFYNVLKMAQLGVFPEHLFYVREKVQRLIWPNKWDDEVGSGALPTEATLSFMKYPILKDSKVARAISRRLEDCSQTSRSEPQACWPINNDLTFLLAAIEGPPDTPYEDAVFWLFIRITEGFPFHPPAVTFLTRIYHPNINQKGEICMNLLNRGWSTGVSFQTLLISIMAILDDPGLDDPLVPEIAETYIRDPELYRENARKYTVKYAMAPDQICNKN